MILRACTLTTAVLALAVMSGCTAPDGGPNRTGTGAIIGGLTGAAAGQIIGGDRQATAVGTIIGTAAGVLIGNSLDAQERQLRAELGSNASVVNTGSELVVTLPENVTFDFGSAVVRPAYRSTIASLSRSLQTYPDSTVIVTGHTDNVGSAEVNQRLSEQRAAAVAQLLIETGTSAPRIRIVGRSFNDPIASNDTDAGRAANRRVVVTIRPNS